MQTETYSRIAWIALAVFVVLHVCMPLTTGSINSGHDTLRYVPRLTEFHENIRHGVFIPRWAPDLILGQGQPLFFFSPPLPYYIAELWRVLGLDNVRALNCASISMIVLSAAAMFLLCRLYFGETGGLLGAIAYVYSPYFHVDLYVRGAFSEFTALAFCPLALYGFARYARENNTRALILGSAAFAAVILSHNPTALLFAPLLAGFAAFQSLQRRSWRLLGSQSAAMGLSLALSAFFWAPALLEIGNVHSERLTGGYLDYRLHFVNIQQLVSTFWGYGGSVPGTEDQMSLSLGWSHVLLGVIALALSFQLDRPLRRMQWFFAGALIAFVFLMLPASAPIWRVVPLMQFTQFPWRLLAPASISLGVLIASLGGIMDGKTLRTSALLAIAALMLVVPNWDHPAPQSTTFLDPEDWTPSSIARRGVETTAMREFETRWVERVLPYDPERFRIVEGDASVTLIEARPGAWTAKAVAGAPSSIEARLLYFPGWSVTVDGTEAPIAIAPGTGRIRFDLSPGEHEIRIELKRTTPVLIGEGISLAGVLLLALGVLHKRAKAPPLSGLSSLKYSV